MLSQLITKSSLGSILTNMALADHAPVIVFGKDAGLR
jgi:hypothetical protein